MLGQGLLPIWCLHLQAKITEFLRISINPLCKCVKCGAYFGTCSLPLCLVQHLFSSSSKKYIFLCQDPFHFNNIISLPCHFHRLRLLQTNINQRVNFLLFIKFTDRDDSYYSFILSRNKTDHYSILFFR